MNKESDLDFDKNIDKLSIFYEDNISIWFLMFMLFLAKHSKHKKDDKEDE